jgi:hypothetical protein
MEGKGGATTNLQFSESLTRWGCIGKMPSSDDLEYPKDGRLSSTAQMQKIFYSLTHGACGESVFLYRAVLVKFAGVNRHGVHV